MKFTPLAASLLALALFSAPTMAAEQPAPIILAQAEAPQEVVDFLADTRPVAEFSAEELTSRFKQARKLSKMDGLAPEVSDQLKEIAKAVRAEIAAREEQAAKPAEPAVEQPAAEQPVVEQPVVEQPVVEQPVVEQPVVVQPVVEQPVVEQPVVEQPVVEQPAVEQPVVEQPAEVAAPTPTEIPAEVTDLLNDTRPLSEMSPDELTKRARAARKFSKADNLPEDMRNQLAEIAKSARGELVSRDQPAEQKTPDAPVVEAPVVEEPAPTIVEKAPVEPLPEPPPAVVEAPPPAPAEAAPVVVDKSQAKTLDGNAGTPEAEAKAQEILADSRAAEKLTDEELRARLDGIRALMADNELSRDTERTLRKKLKAERDILRDRVAAAEAAASQKKEETTAAKPADKKPRKDKGSKFNISIEFVLNDRRPSEELEDYELERRLEVYRQSAFDRQYDEDQRNYWRAVMERDQYLLQQRLLRERRDREAELASRADDEEYDVEIDREYEPDRPRRDVYAAEVDDAELEDVLVSAPRSKPKRRYSVAEIEDSPDLRETLPRIEIDTVRFGFNEAFVRAEEVGNLDRIAEVMERILTKHPREVFLIEGHTDAVGSDAANLALSRQRATAIKKALTTYYVISAKNLETVGYGERYLKVPTAEAEQENRRVSVSRATALIGELEE